MLSLFVSILMPLIVLGLLLWLVGMLPIDAKIMQIIRVVAIIIVVLWLIGFFFGAVPGYNSAPFNGGALRTGRC